MRYKLTKFKPDLPPTFEFVLPRTMFSFFNRNRVPTPANGPEGAPPKQKINVGVRVKGKLGELVPNPIRPKGRKVRSHGTGTVVEVVGKHKFKVKTDFDGTYLIGTSSTLTVVNDSVGIPMNKKTGVLNVSFIRSLILFYFILQ